MRVMVTGGSGFADFAFVEAVLDRVNSRRRITLIIHGCGPGVDALADYWARKNDVPVEAFAGDWQKYGRAADAVRNTDMISFPPDLVVVFPGGRETAICKAQAEASGRAVIVPKYWGNVRRASTTNRR